MADDGLLARVEELRERGSTPKQIARVLGLPTARVAPLVRQLAAAREEQRGPDELPLLDCWINSGWSVGLGLDEVPEWAATDPVEGPTGYDGLAGVLVARQARGSQVVLCGYLLDLFCLGVKDVFGPVVGNARKAVDDRRMFFKAFDSMGGSCPLELARNLVYGAAAYAASLGFEPHPDFEEARAVLGPAPDTVPIRFGRDGRTVYVPGPYDDQRHIVKTLSKRLGKGNYDVVTVR